MRNIPGLDMAIDVPRYHKSLLITGLKLAVKWQNRRRGEFSEFLLTRVKRSRAIKVPFGRLMSNCFALGS